MYVYFIEEVDGEYIKIGISKRPRERIISLQRFNARKLKIITTIRGDYELENLIHRRFKHIRSHGEWFEATKELKQFISDLHNVEFAGGDMLERATAFTKQWGIPY